VITAKLSGKHDIEIWGDGHQPAASCISTIASLASKDPAQRQRDHAD